RDKLVTGVQTCALPILRLTGAACTTMLSRPGASGVTKLARVDSSGLVTPLAPGLDSIVVQAAPVSRSAPLTIGGAPSVTLQTLEIGRASRRERVETSGR